MHDSISPSLNKRMSIHCLEYHKLMEAVDVFSLLKPFCPDHHRQRSLVVPPLSHLAKATPVLQHRPLLDLHGVRHQLVPGNQPVLHLLVSQVLVKGKVATQRVDRCFRVYQCHCKELASSEVKN